MGRIIAFLLILILWNSPILVRAQSFKVFAQDLTYSFYKNGKLFWSFKASYFIQYSEHFFKARNIYIENIPKTLKIKGNIGIYDKTKEEFIISGNVSLITPKVGELYTEELIFSPEKNLIVTDKEVLVKKEGMIIKGEGMIYNINTGNLKIKKKAKIKFQL